MHSRLLNSLWACSLLFAPFTLSLWPAPAMGLDAFNWEKGNSWFRDSRAPEKDDLIGHSWIQIGGAHSIKTPKSDAIGPDGFNETGLPSAKKPNKLTFPSEAPLSVQIEFGNGLQNTSARVKYEMKGKDLTFIRLLKASSADADYANYACRQYFENLLCLVALSTPKKEGHRKYYALFKKQDNSILGEMNAKDPISEETAAKPQARSIKCTMKWGSLAGNVEYMSFILFPQPAKLGELSFIGAGGSWTQKHPDVIDKAVVLKAMEEGETTIYYIANVGSDLGFGKNFDIKKEIKNSEGLDMIGTISIDSSDGSARVLYPPGYGQGPKSYAETLKTAPTSAQCVENKATTPLDPYERNLGVLQ